MNYHRMQYGVLPDQISTALELRTDFRCLEVLRLEFR
jgi:hypothetical protein